MRESDLYPPVRQWLLDRGYEVHVEVFGADVVAVKDNQLTVVELKRAWSKELFLQLIDRAGWADFVFAAVPAALARTREATSKTKGARYRGFGVLGVDCERGKVEQIAIARQQPWMFVKRRTYRLKKLAGRPQAMEHEQAGLPSCNALRQQRLNRLNREAMA